MRGAARLLKRVVLLLILALMLLPRGGSAQVQMTPEAALDRLLRAPHADPAWFSPAFLAQVTPAQVDEVLATITQSAGKYRSVKKSGTSYAATYDKGTAQFLVVLDAQGRFEGLRFLGTTMSVARKLSDVLPPIEGMPGRVSYVMYANGLERVSFGQDKALGVGSTFKLAILAALQAEIKQGKRRWSDVVALQAGWKSLPSGVLQDWPVGTPLTVQTLASLMISQSDNTATDSLIQVLGRRAIEPFAGRNVPLLTTRNMFTLKKKGMDAERATWRTGSIAQKRALVSRLDAMPLPAIETLDTSPGLSDIEWHFTNRELCSLMGGVGELPLTQINPGVATKSQWKRVSYKGGSDFGVISMTTELRAKNGRRYCVSVTENDDKNPVDESAFAAKYSALIDTLVSGTVTH